MEDQKNNERTWGNHERSVWWIKNILQNLVWAITIAAAVVAGGRWFYTRASDDDVDKKVNITDHKEVIGEIKYRIDKSEKLLNVININVARMLEHSDVKPDRLPNE